MGVRKHRKCSGVLCAAPADKILAPRVGVPGGPRLGGTRVGDA